MSLSGSILVFHDDIDHAIYEEHLALNEPAQNVIVDASFEKIRRGYPGLEIRVPELPQSDREALKYELRNGDRRKWVIAHPETGAIMSTVDDAHKRLVFTLLTLHFSFFAGTNREGIGLNLRDNISYRPCHRTDVIQKVSGKSPSVQAEDLPEK